MAEAKNMQNLAVFWTWSNFDANISGMDENIKNQKINFSQRFLPHSATKVQ